jgi:hypothetical protein
MTERYGFALHPWAGIFPAFPELYPMIPREGIWFWADFPQRKPYIRRKTLN